MFHFSAGYMTDGKEGMNAQINTNIGHEYESALHSQRESS